MTREQLLVLGFTEEQVNQIMGLHGTATQSLRNQISTLTTDLQNARNGNNPPVNPPANNDSLADNEEYQNALNRIEELERENARKDIVAYASSKGLSGDQVQNILNAFGDNVDTAKSAIDSMAQIISENRAAAAQEKEDEIARNASNPGGGSGGGGDQKSQPEQIAAKLFGGQKQSNDILSHYVNGGN